MTYLLEADSEEAVSIKADENSGVAWFAPEEALAKSAERGSWNMYIRN